jgi:outer membrane lipoprotein-sorting protein
MPIHSGLLGFAFVSSFAAASVFGAAQVPGEPGGNAVAGVPAQAADKAATKPGALQGAGTGPGGAMTPGPVNVPSASEEEPATQAEQAIDAAVRKIGKLQSVSADLVQEVEMLRQNFTMKGQYRKAPNTRVYLLLTISSGLPDSSGRLLQVCDGETLWEAELVLDQSFYRKMSIKPILERLNSPDLDPEIRAKAMTQMGLAGPETLLVSLRKIIRFDSMTETVFEGRKVWKIHGLWKNRQGLMFESRAVNPVGVLPPYIPMDATLYLGIDDGWPYQLILEGREDTVLKDSRQRGPDGKIIGSKASIEKIPRTKITITYSNVKLNTPIRLDEFVFQAPANASVADDTESITKTLDRALEGSALKKKTEAARKEGDVLEQTIDVPVPGGGSPGASKPRE